MMEQASGRGMAAAMEAEAGEAVVRTAERATAYVASRGYV